jgi:phosphonate transport system substrate-binding protein
MSSLLRAGEKDPIQQELPLVRFCISGKLFREVNENDARVSVKAYAKQVVENRGIAADPNPIIFSGTDQLSKLLRARAVDLISMPTPEFLALDENLVTGPFLISIINGSEYEEYVLVARFDSEINGLPDLKGRKVLVLDNLTSSLAGPWLEVLLGQEELGSPEMFFRLGHPVKVSRAVLPVIFRQADACVVTRQGFALTGELNPQITKQLRILASSPRLVPHLTCFRSGFDNALKQKVAAAVVNVNATAAGKQVMTIFECEQIEERPASTLQSARDLLAAQARLQKDAATLKPATSTLTSPSGQGSR